MGVCSRWAVAYKHDKTPIEGTLYVHKAKANRRLSGLQNPEKFEVIEVAVMPLDVAHRIIAAIPEGAA